MSFGSHAATPTQELVFTFKRLADVFCAHSILPPMSDTAIRPDGNLLNASDIKWYYENDILLALVTSAQLCFPILLPLCQKPGPKPEPNPSLHVTTCPESCLTLNQGYRVTGVEEC